ncbi:MAG TPA: CGNR zinc finger domain-containing protein [Bryobacteraceae bacterium]|nr:CGNR zinc finger domain-containing protein [Bryobacteraceae bacterium]
MAIAKDFRFIGRLCLDFAQTGDMGFGTRFERLTSPAELQRWLSLSALQLSTVKITANDLERAKKLRGAIWRAAEAVLSNAAPAGADIRLINGIGGGPCLARELDSEARAMRWRRPTAAAAFATIAQDAVLLFGDEVQRGRLRRCENSGCRAIFYDDSRPGLRRWCASNRCGDRVRARLYRERRRQ